MKITDRLKSLLETHGVSQAAFADAVSLRRETVNRWFNGSIPFNPERETIDRILAFARGLDPSITFESLFGGGESRRCPDCGEVIVGSQP